MSGTIAGGIKSRDHIKKTDPDFYKRIGAIGGRRTGPTKGFGMRTPCDCDLLDYPHHKGQCAAKKGGMASKPYSRKPRPVRVG